VDDEQFQQIARTLADPSRLAALQMIARQGQTSCMDVREHLGLTAATVSHHAKELIATGLVDHHKEAKFLILSLNREVWNAYLNELQRRIPNL
jgi:ArsR family transcriptional regulator, arsenate/arsenite/antimonite-responsive transcriptional repressor